MPAIMDGRNPRFDDARARIKSWADEGESKIGLDMLYKIEDLSNDGGMLEVLLVMGVMVWLFHLTGIEEGILPIIAIIAVFTLGPWLGLKISKSRRERIKARKEKQLEDFVAKTPNGAEIRRRVEDALGGY